MSDLEYNRIYAQYVSAVDQCFERVQALDEELCERLIATFGSRHASVVWLTTYKATDEVPIVLLLNGHRAQVIDALGRLEHCVYS